jgi:hypothetical protein
VNALVRAWAIDRIARNFEGRARTERVGLAPGARPNLRPFTGTRLRAADAVAASVSPTLQDFGGPVQTQASVHLIYAGSYWQGQGAADRAHMDGFARQLPNSPYAGLLAQYRGARPPAWSGSDVVPAQLNQMDEGGLARIIAPYANASPNTIHTVILAPGTVLTASDGSSSLNGLGGYHGNVQTGGRLVYYAGIQADGINLDGVRRHAMTTITGHELAEFSTDPNVEQNQLSFYNNTYGEIGDPAMSVLPLRQTFTLVPGVDLNGRAAQYAMQRLWSNRDNGFTVGLPNDFVPFNGTGAAQGGYAGGGPQLAAHALPQIRGRGQALVMASERLGKPVRALQATPLAGAGEAVRHVRSGGVVAATGRAGLLPYGVADGPVTLAITGETRDRLLTVRDPRVLGPRFIAKEDLAAFVQGSPVVGSLVAIH